tara:strand:+ start:351 stop:533 length:183 start_codon:yes stop_codon:yes gene_type:complete
VLSRQLKNAGENENRNAWCKDLENIYIAEDLLNSNIPAESLLNRGRGSGIWSKIIHIATR